MESTEIKLENDVSSVSDTVIGDSEKNENHSSLNGSRPATLLCNWSCTTELPETRGRTTHLPLP